MGLACISVDLDSLPHYCRIHGLPQSLLDEKARRMVYTTALRRFLELLSELSLPATLFAIGEDLSDEVAVAALRQAQRLGIEIANHSYAHDYAISRKPDLTIQSEVERGAQSIEAAVERAPVGFRAPGYAMSAALYQALTSRNYRYDSSVFPAVPYYLAKAAVMGSLAVRGRASQAILDTPAVLLAPPGPYFPDPENPYRRGNGAVVELPISTHPFTRVPFIGTFVTTFPRAVVRGIYRSMPRSTLLNFELHAIDLLDESDGIPTELTRRQRDLRVSTKDKWSRLKEVFEWIKADYQTLTLAEAAARAQELMTPRHV